VYDEAEVCLCPRHTHLALRKNAPIARQAKTTGLHGGLRLSCTNGLEGDVCSWFSFARCHFSMSWWVDVHCRRVQFKLSQQRCWPPQPFYPSAELLVWFLKLAWCISWWFQDFSASFSITELRLIKCIFRAEEISPPASSTHTSQNHLFSSPACSRLPSAATRKSKWRCAVCRGCRPGRSTSGCGRTSARPSRSCEGSRRETRATGPGRKK